MRAHVSVHIGQDTWENDVPGRCHVDDGPALAPETVHLDHRRNN